MSSFDYLCTDDDEDKIQHPFGPQNWYTSDRARRACPRPLVALRRRIYNLPSPICVWLRDVIQYTERSRQPAVGICGNNKAFDYLLCYDEVKCTVTMKIQEVMNKQQRIYQRY